MIDAVTAFIGTTAGKALLVAVMVLLARKWSRGDFDKPMKNLRQVGREYGIVTILLLLLWWVLTPSGLPDDYVAVWLLATIGLVPYILLLGALTVYLIWRLRVTIVIYRK